MEPLRRRPAAPKDLWLRSSSVLSVVSSVTGWLSFGFAVVSSLAEAGTWVAVFVATAGAFGIGGLLLGLGGFIRDRSRTGAVSALLGLALALALLFAVASWGVAEYGR